jgi:hypothetical protein
MKIIWDNRNGMPKLIFEEKDLMNAIYIQEMIKGESICRKCGTIYESKGWEVLKEYMECEKMKLEAKMESGIAPNKMIPEEKSQVQIALWKGFKHFMSLPERIIEQAEKIREDMRKQEEIKREARNDE